MTVSQLTCRICGSIDNHPTFIGREMMFGTLEEFEYFQCKICECLQITNIPKNLGHFYPDSYYSLNTIKKNRPSILHAFLLKQRFRNAIFGRGYKLNRLLSSLVKMPDIRIDGVIPVTKVLQDAKIRNFSARFLDIGCGGWSEWLENLKIMGFQHLFGVDPFISSDINKDGINIYKREIDKMTGLFDLITFHHSLEHIPNQHLALAAAKKILSPTGVIVIRIPIVSSYAWNHYGTNWVEMDAPRHLYLHSKNSIHLAAEQAGLRQFNVLCDSIELEFYGSEQYQRGISLTAKESHWGKQNGTVFTKKEMHHFKEMAQQVNNKGECGRACFFYTSK